MTSGSLGFAVLLLLLLLLLPTSSKGTGKQTEGLKLFFCLRRKQVKSIRSTSTRILKRAEVIAASWTCDSY